MALQLWMGPSGSGKTTSLYEWLIREAERSSAFQALLIVPEQFTMQTQKDLVSLHPRHSVANIDILSFDRLAYRVLGEQGAENLTVLDDMGKLLVLRRAASLCGKELTLFRKNLDKAGFIDKIKSMLSELYQYRIDEGQLRELIAATGGQPLLKRKLEEILTLYTAFDHSMQEDTIPSERLLDVLCRLIPDSGLIRTSAVAFDGFTGFTPAQYQVLEALMRHAKQVIVTAPTDEDLQEPLFEMGRTMVRTLRTLAAKGGIAEEESRLLPPGLRFQESPALAVLERQFLRCPAMPMTEKDDSGSLRLWEVD